jgi:hypothetical protein
MSYVSSPNFKIVSPDMLMGLPLENVSEIIGEPFDKFA